MSREFEKEKPDMLLDEEDWDSLLEEDDEFDAAVKEEYIKEAEEIERSLFPEGLPRETAASEEETRASYERLVELMKKKGIYREDTPADSAAANDVSMDSALAADAPDNRSTGAFAGEALAFVPGAGGAAGIRLAVQPDSVREHHRSAMHRQFKMVRAAGIAVACFLGVFLASMTSEANRTYVVRTVKYLVGDDVQIAIDNDENSDISLQDERQIRKIIEKETGIKIPVIMYYPDNFEYYDYYIREDAKTASIQYMYNNNIIYFFVSNIAEFSTSRSYSSQGDEETVSYIDIEDGNIQVCIIKTIDEKEEKATYTAQWEKQGAVYQLSGRIEKDVLLKIIESMEY